MHVEPLSASAASPLTAGALAVALVALAQGAMAQQQPAPSGTLPDVTIRSSLLQSSAEQTPASVSVIDGEQLRDRQWQVNLSEALAAWRSRPCGQHPVGQQRDVARAQTGVCRHGRAPSFTLGTHLDGLRQGRRRVLVAGIFLGHRNEGRADDFLGRGMAAVAAVGLGQIGRAGQIARGGAGLRRRAGQQHAAKGGKSKTHGGHRV